VKHLLQSGHPSKMASAGSSTTAIDCAENQLIDDSLTHPLTYNPQVFENHLRTRPEAVALLKKYYYTVVTRAAEWLLSEENFQTQHSQRSWRDGLEERRRLVWQLHTSLRQDYLQGRFEADQEDKLRELLRVSTK
jgi:hypothetical protein